MAAPTPPTPLETETWLAGLEAGPRVAESRALLALFQAATGYPPRLWGGGIVGFGRYAYRYASGHGGESLATGFSPRKADISVYVMPGYDSFGEILSRLGPHRLGKACLYIRKLEAVDEQVLAELVRAGLDELARQWTVHPI